jgi:hypothetical protein
MPRPCKLAVLTWSLLTAVVVTAAGLGLRAQVADASRPLWPELSALDEVPEEDLSAADRRGDAKHEVALELVAGHLTLLEAAARFRTINAGHPHGEKFSHCSLPGGTYEEWLCRQVISWRACAAAGGNGTLGAVLLRPLASAADHHWRCWRNG